LADPLQKAGLPAIPNQAGAEPMRTSIVAIFASALTLVFVAQPAAAEEKNPGKLEKMLTAKLGSKIDFIKDAKFKQNKQFKDFIKYTCQKGNAFGGTFGVCRSGEGVVCGAKKEAYVACAVVCGVLGASMSESAGFAESKCVTKHGKDKWGFENHEAAVEWAKEQIKAKGQNVGPVVKLCAALKPHMASLPGEVKSFAEACP
jgi:hypothetical protein